jgi:hypothetical protein
MRLSIVDESVFVNFVCSSLLLVGFGRASAQSQCAAVPTPVVNYTTNTYYVDRHHSIVDRAKYEKFKKSVAPINDFESAVARYSDGFVQAEDTVAGECALAYLGEWAGARALLGQVEGFQAQAVRNWNTAGYAFAFMKVSSLCGVNQTENSNCNDIRLWLRQLAAQVKRYFGTPRRPFNNNKYWATLTVLTVGVATQDADYVKWAEKEYRAAIARITPDGFLPGELVRGDKTYAYHNFAATALVAIRALLVGDGLLARNGPDAVKLVSVLKRLYRAESVGPIAFADRVNVKQDRRGPLVWPGLVRFALGREYWWLETGLKQGDVTTFYPRLGGTVSLMPLKE